MRLLKAIGFTFSMMVYGTMIACKKCKRSFDKVAHNGYCPFCGENNN
jgi:Zn finger protein HypA/HybF involved in hydrogenase expression